jgi:hypothetical protein
MFSTIRTKIVGKALRETVSPRDGTSPKVWNQYRICCIGKTNTKPYPVKCCHSPPLGCMFGRCPRIDEHIHVLHVNAIRFISSISRTTCPTLSGVLEHAGQALLLAAVRGSSHLLAQPVWVSHPRHGVRNILHHALRNTSKKALLAAEWGTNACQSFFCTMSCFQCRQSRTSFGHGSTLPVHNTAVSCIIRGLGHLGCAAPAKMFANILHHAFTSPQLAFRVHHICVKPSIAQAA